MLTINTLINSLTPGHRLNYTFDGHFKPVRERQSRCCFIKQRANGESTKHKEAVQQALEPLKTILQDKSQVNQENLLKLHDRLKHRISYIRKYTTGFIGWIYSLFRKKSETKALCELGHKLRDMYDLINRTELVSQKILNNALPSDFKKGLDMIRAELPHLLCYRNPTTADFGITETNFIPTVPFFIQPSRPGFYLTFPPTSVTPYCTTVCALDLASIKPLYEQYMTEQKILLVNTCTHLNSADLDIEDIRLDGKKVVLTYTRASTGKVFLSAYVFNCLSQKKEIHTLEVEQTMRVETIQKWVNDFIRRSENQIEEVERFIATKFPNGQSYDEQGTISRHWKGYYELRYTFNGIPLNKVEPGLSEASYNRLAQYQTLVESNAVFMKRFNSLSDVEQGLPSGQKIEIASDPGSSFKIYIINTQLGEFSSSTDRILIKVIPFNTDLKEAIQTFKYSLIFNTFTKTSPQALDAISPLTAFRTVEKLPDIDLKQLKTLAREVNFSDYNLNTADDGAFISADAIQRNVGFIVNMIKSHNNNIFVQHHGIPDHRQERIDYFNDLEPRLMHIVKALEKPENKVMIPEVIVNLGVARQKCGVRWKQEVHKYFSMLCRPEVNESTVDLQEWLQHFLDQEKVSVLTLMTAEDDHDLHIQLRYLKQLKRDHISVPGWEAANYTDRLDHRLGLLNQLITEMFLEKFDLTPVLVRANQELNTKLSDYSNSIVCQHFGTQVYQRLEIAVKQWLLPHHAKKGEFEAATTDSQRKQILGQLIQEHQLLTEDEETYTTNGVTFKGMVLLALQSDTIILKQEQSLLKLFRSLDALNKVK